MSFAGQVLFDNVVFNAVALRLDRSNGCGKSTFMKIVSGDQSLCRDIHGKKLGVLRQTTTNKMNASLMSS